METAVKNPEVTQILGELEKALQEHEEALENLGVRLSEVMCQDAPSVDEKAQDGRESSCPLSEALLDKVKKVQRVTRHVNNLMGRLEV